MKNTLSVTTVNESVHTEFVCDGVTCLEIHRQGIPDAKILTKLVDKKYYQYLKGEWTIIFPNDQYSVTKPTFEAAIESAQTHIFNRDNSFPDYSDFC